MPARAALSPRVSSLLSSLRTRLYANEAEELSSEWKFCLIAREPESLFALVLPLGYSCVLARMTGLRVIQIVT